MSYRLVKLVKLNQIVRLSLIDLLLNDKIHSICFLTINNLIIYAINLSFIFNDFIAYVLRKFLQIIDKS